MLTFRRLEASLGVNRTEKSKGCLFIGVFAHRMRCLGDEELVNKAPRKMLLNMAVLQTFG
jgi:hypothetical protein